jgi:hypothetical protein
MQREPEIAMSEALRVMVLTTDGRRVRHVVSRLDAALCGLGWSAWLREQYIAAVRSVADTIAQRPAVPGPKRPGRAG